MQGMWAVLASNLDTRWHDTHAYGSELLVEMPCKGSDGTWLGASPQRNSKFREDKQNRNSDVSDILIQVSLVSGKRHSCPKSFFLFSRHSLINNSSNVLHYTQKFCKFACFAHDGRGYSKETWGQWYPNALRRGLRLSPFLTFTCADMQILKSHKVSTLL